MTRTDPLDLRLLSYVRPFCLGFHLPIEADIDMAPETQPAVIVRARKLEWYSLRMASELSNSCAEISASVAEPSALVARFRSIGRLPNHLVFAQLLQLNQQNRHLEAELLLYLGELDRRQIYREQAIASAFEFCVLRLGYSEDVAFKRVGAARLMRRFPLIYDLLVAGRIHLTALMLLKPHLTEENHEEWLFLACEKSKRQVEKLVASRCPRPDVPASIRKLPGARPLPLEANLQSAVKDSERLEGAIGQASGSTTATMKAQSSIAQVAATQVAATQMSNEPVAATQLAATQLTAAQATVAQVTHATATTVTPPAARIAPLSGRTYRVTFTACERLKQKLDRAAELLSHCIHPSDLPALVERAIDQLLEREEKRRYGARRPSNSPSIETDCGDRSSRAVRPSNHQSIETACGASLSQTVRPSSSQSVELAGKLGHESCQEDRSKLERAQDPDPYPALDLAPAPIGLGISSARALATNQGSGTEVQRAAMVKSKRRRHVPAAVRRAVFERDDGQCTFVDHEGRRCEQRHFLEFDHIDAHALGGTETVANLRLVCSMHNALEAERLFGRERVGNVIQHALQARRR